VRRKTRQKNWLDAEHKRAKQHKVMRSIAVGLIQATEDINAAVNVVDMPSDGEIGGREKLEFPEEFPAGELPEKANECAETLYHTPRQADKESERGQSLTDLTTEKHTVRTKQKLTEPGRWSDSYTNENQFEDTDKLGDADSLEDAVYPPYTDGIGQPSPRYEDTNKEKHNIVVHAEGQEADPNRGPGYLWVAVDLDGTILEIPPEYQDEEGNHLFGEPISGAREALQELMDNDVKVSIYSARQYFAHGHKEEQKLKEAIENELTNSGIPFTEVYVGKKPPAHVYVDDRNVPFAGDWDTVLNTLRDKYIKKTTTKSAGDDPVKDQKDYHGIKINVEWPRGSIRSYEGNDTYVTHMKCDYGYAPGIDGGEDGDLDIYLGDGDSDTAYILEQLKDDGSYDEDKVMLGFMSEDEAAECYLQHMPAHMMGTIREVPIETLVNALYGKPEDRRGQEDQVPSEEINTTKKAQRPNYLFVYGILRKGEPYYEKYLKDSKFIRNVKTKPKYHLIITQAAGMAPGENAVDGELYEVPDEVMAEIDKYEHPYNRQEIELEDGSAAYAYFTPDEIQDVVEEAPRMNTGDKESSVWPEDKNREEELLDTDYTRENRDIARDPTTETMKYKG